MSRERGRNCAKRKSSRVRNLFPSSLPLASTCHFIAAKCARHLIYSLPIAAHDLSPMFDIFFSEYLGSREDERRKPRSKTDISAHSGMLKKLAWKSPKIFLENFGRKKGCNNIASIATYLTSAVKYQVTNYLPSHHRLSSILPQQYSNHCEREPRRC